MPNDLIFSFYIQGFKLVLAIYTVKANETTKQIVRILITKPLIMSHFIKNGNKIKKDRMRLNTMVK